MQNRYKIIPIFIPVTLILGLMLGSSFNSPSSSTLSSIATEHGGIACVQVTRADGTVEPESCSHNVFTAVGRNMTRDYLGAGTSLSAINVIAISQLNESTDVDTTTLPGEWTLCGLTKIAGTGPTPINNAIGGASTSGNWSVTKTFTSTCDNMLVNGTALMNGTAAGNKTFAIANFTSATLQTNDQINVTWFVYVA
jgi:hypothetical protein